MFTKPDTSQWILFVASPSDELRSLAGEKIAGQAVRRNVGGHWQYMNVDEDELWDEMLLAFHRTQAA